jgi:uncharacterized membrane protein
MNPTMRQYLFRRQLWSFALFIVGVVLAILPAVLAKVTGGAYMLHEHREAYFLITIGGLLVVVVAMVRSRLNCPKCNKPLSAVATGSEFDKRPSAAAMWTVVPPTCPSCGVNFDEPMPHTPISPIS